MLPFIISIFLQKKIIEFPSTHLIASNSLNPVEVNKQMFIFLILLSGVGFYFLSLIVSKNLYVLLTKMNIVYFRYIFTCILSALTIILLLENLRWN